MIKDKKNMKKRWKRIISNMIAIALVIISSIPTISIPVKAEASVDGKLITVGGKTVTKNMKIDDVKKMFGEPKLTTPSYWDGYAYTFYGKDYSDYLYLETDSDGKIVCYGSVSPGFETNKYSYGEKVNPYARAGCEAKDDDGKLYAVIYYTKFHLDAYKRFTENLTENNRNLCKHAVEMWNAISYLYGYKTATYFDEKLFNIGAQLADNHSDLYDYCKSTNQSSCYQSMTGRKATFLEYFYHIHFAIQRYEDHMNFPNPMLREVRLFYEKEFALGEYALGMIKQRLNISLPLDDAASIALHIVSAEFDTRVKDTLKITEFLEDVMEQIKNYFHLEIDTQSLSYERFITHLKFLSRKLFASERMDDMNNDVQEMIQKICPEEYQCAGYIKTFIKERYKKDMTSAEVAYLTMHIERIRKSSIEKGEEDV